MDVFYPNWLPYFMDVFFTDIAMTVEYWDPNGWAMLKKQHFGWSYFYLWCLNPQFFMGQIMLFTPQKQSKMESFMKNTLW